MTSGELGDGGGHGAGEAVRADRGNDAQWRHAILASIHEGVLVFDATGLVLEMNQAFSELFGYDLTHEPITPPYPWWPTEAEDPEMLTAIWERHDQARAGLVGVNEYRFYSRRRSPVWVSCADATIHGADGSLLAVVRTFRDITPEKEAQARRAAAARLSADFARPDDLPSLLSIAQHGLEALFGGASMIQLDLGDKYCSALNPARHSTTSPMASAPA